MIHIDSKTVKVPTVEEVRAILTAHNNRVGITLDYDRLLEYYSYYTIKANEIKKRIEKYIGIYGIRDLKDGIFLEYLQRMGVTTGFLFTDSGRISMSEDSLKAVVDTGLYSEEINTIIRKYSEMKAYLQKVNMFEGILEKGTLSKIESCDNHRMWIVHPKWVPQNTGRLGMTEPALMNVAKALSDIQTVPKGWILLEADSGQIEPRINQSWILHDPQLKKCTMLYNDAYFGYVHYCNILTPQQRASGTLDFEKVDLSDDIVAKRKKYKNYGNAVMYGSMSNRDKDPDKDAFIRCIGKHPSRLEFVEKLEKKVLAGQTIFYTALGTPIDISKSAKLVPGMSEDERIYELTKLAINNPVQATAADLFRISVVEAHKLLREKAPYSWIIKYVHDSGSFAVNEDDYDNVIKDLREVTSYQIDDWIPVYNDPIEGIHREDKMPRLVH